MIRTTAVPRPVRVGAAFAGIAGMLALAGCATAQDAAGTGTPAASTAPSTASSTAPSTGASAPAGAASGAYKDGSYTAQGSYATPESVESVTVTVTLSADVITAVEVTGNPQKAESQDYQSKFIGGISDAVVGKKIDEISVSRVAGSSLTSGGFNEAIAQIKTEAAG